MNATLSTQTVVEIGLVLALLAGLGLWLYYQQQKKQSLRLREKFGPEYGRTVMKLGSRTKAEGNLRAREKRVDQLKIVPLQPADAERFIHAWKALQARFVDDPRGVVVQADQLVRELMQKRGYPMGDFNSRAADISVDHPAVVENYRVAQEIAIRAEKSDASTEDLRKAVVHFRALFDELLEVMVANDETVDEIVDEGHEEIEVHP